MKKHYKTFTEVCATFEEQSGFSFQEDRVCFNSTEHRCYYDAKFRDDTNHLAIVRIFLQQSGEIRWKTGWDQAAEELYELYEAWTLADSAEEDVNLYIQAS
ncbi:MAG: hypothetical protein ACQEXV_22615 [Bacillota bacterium]